MAFGTPRVSVLLPVYNGAAFLHAAVVSILAQTFRDFELLTIDDGSTDGSLAILRSFNDSRLKIHVNRRNIGLNATLNLGLRLCRGEYIARMDADDISHRRRLEVQTAYLDAHPVVGLVGSSIWVIDRRGRLQDFVPQPAGDAAIRFVAMTKNPFHHPTAMFRSEILKRNALTFNERYPNQDFKLWVDMLRFTKGANLAKPLLKYRIHGDNFSIANSAEQIDTSVRFCQEAQRATLGQTSLTSIQLQSIFRHFFGSTPDRSCPEDAETAETAMMELESKVLAIAATADHRQIRLWTAYLAPSLARRIDRVAWLRQFVLRLPANILWLRRFVSDVCRLKLRGIVARNERQT